MERETNTMNMLLQFAANLLQRFAREEDGQDLVEYALIVAAVGLALITTVNQLTTAVVSLYSSITQGLTSIGATGA
jgi:pilus assembly protein Flp/PilA